MPQPPKQTAGKRAVNSCYNPLTTKQNPTAAPSAMDAIYSKPALHGDVPRPQMYLGGYTPPQQNSNQTPKMLKPAGNAAAQQKPKMLKPNNTAKTQSDRKVLYGPNREAAIIWDYPIN